ncbi:DoxX family protein [Lacicoccus alkaliphilus]|uniref:Uncharacterized membrane protein n=1 Tax=Lacicoccus alkaliphilus DSM 16010 TaxID=1123231 RepID=A0A1M7FYW8_9BACL|nr:MauE/DoxX family redox-associated membrane protein [Salinicoccus alkaliphilus]SHM09241.1 Uncharacterized membrane protein [Salinicoccus alkaliphilus DSM 16010]
MKRMIMGTVFTVAGIAHFLTPERFANIIPGFVPFKKFLALFTGVLELIFGLMLLFNKYRNWHITSMQAFLWAVYPANIYMLTHRSKIGLSHVPRWILILRLPLQWVMSDSLEKLKK